MEDLIKQRKRMNPVRMELSRELDKKTVSSLCKDIHVEKDWDTDIRTVWPKQGRGHQTEGKRSGGGGEGSRRGRGEREEILRFDAGPLIFLTSYSIENKT